MKKLKLISTFAKVFLLGAMTCQAQEVVSGTPTTNAIKTNDFFVIQSAVSGGSGFAQRMISVQNALKIGNGYENRIAYVRTTGNDSSGAIGNVTKAFASPLAALNAVKAAYDGNYYVIDIGAGTYDMGDSPLLLTNKVIVQGAGMDATVLLYGGEEHADGTAIMPWDNCWITDLTLSVTNGASLDQTCIGILSDSPNAAAVGTNYIVNVKGLGGAHTLQLNPSSTNGCKFVARNCYMSNPNSPAQVLGTNNVIEIYDSFLEAVGPELRGRSFSCGVLNFGGTLFVENCYFRIRPADNVSVGACVTDKLPGSSIQSGITNILLFCVFDLEGTGITTKSDLYLDAKSGSTNYTFTYGCTRKDNVDFTVTSVNGVTNSYGDRFWVSGSITTNIGTITAGSDLNFSFSVPGATVGDPVVIGLDNAAATASNANGIIWTTWVTAANTVGIRVRNSGSSSFAPGSQAYKVRVLKTK